MKIQIIDHRHTLLVDVMILGKQNAKTLGLFPKDAYIDHARKKFIYGAIINDKLVGFVLFRITQSKQMVFITQLCISEDHRGKGVAKALLDQIKSKYGKLFNGIGLSCRRDYSYATKLWESYGFKALKQVRSRSKEEKYLIKWYYDFGNKNLFSSSEQVVYKMNALLDSNIIIKLRDEPNNSNIEALALFADWLTEESDFFYAPEIFNEVLRDSNLIRAQETRTFLNTLKNIQFNPAERDNIYTKLLDILPGESDNDKSDRLQLSECIAGNLEYFITLDKKLLDKSDAVYELYSVRILRPAEFILFIDHNRKPNDYRSLRFAGANYEYCKLTEEDIEQLADAKWLDSNSNEKKHSLLNKLTAVVANIRNSSIRLVKDNNKNCLGYFAATWNLHVLYIKIIRVAKLKISDVLFQQLTKDIILLALENNCSVVTMEETNLTQDQQNILESFGFRPQETILSKVSIRGIYNFSDFLSQNELIKNHINIESLNINLQNYTIEEQDIIKLGVERKLAPIKFEDIRVPIYIIPIKPYWASQLFDHHIANHSLFGSKPELSWNRENVYYRNVNPVSEVAPGRILWYVSSELKTKTGRESSIVACSYLDEVHIGPAKILYRKFKNYGIYEWKDILELTNNNPNKEIKALKFIDTEVFKKNVPLSQISKIFIEHKKPANTFASPVKISSEIFNSVYKLAYQ